ncbi:bis(5'-nucleosyl)-tetraphosphatase (symmetrical) YqeK [Lacrimispora sp.]|uniref:bis(5'-nucleosyl)-tetraphosphatase (symmetrical) YqeK n=1 Tax=Lacrimispora sp. TaxID=2719234 RepID=UPI0032E39BC4
MIDVIMELRNDLKEKLNPLRFEHTLSVSFICTALAMRYSCNLDQAELAGLLHDCAKHYGNEEIIKKCRKQDIQLTDDELKAPVVLHAKYGAWLAENKYNVTDQEVLNAIRWHTTGRPQMSLLEKIVFTADYIEPRRERAPDLLHIRSLAFTDLDECVYQILKNTLEYLESKGSFVDSVSNQAYAYYKQVHNEKKGETR